MPLKQFQHCLEVLYINNGRFQLSVFPIILIHQLLYFFLNTRFTLKERDCGDPKRIMFTGVSHLTQNYAT